MEKSAFILRWPGTDYKIWINSCIKKDFGSSQSISNFKHICIAAARNWNNSNKKKSNKGIHLKTSSFQILTTLLWVFFILNSLWRNLGRIFLKCIQRWQRTVEFCPKVFIISILSQIVLADWHFYGKMSICQKNLTKIYF